MPAQIFFLITLISLIIATYTDLKDRIVSDKLTYTLIFGGLFLQLVFGFLKNSFQNFFFAVIVTIATFVASYILWKMGVWAGGDVKLFTAIAALNPINFGVIRDFFVLNEPIFASIDFPIFPLTLFIFSIFSTIPLAIVLTIKGIIKEKKLQEKIFNDLKAKIPTAIISAILISGSFFTVTYFNLDSLFAIPIILIVGFFGKRTMLIVGGVLFVAGIVLQGTDLIIQAITISITLFAIYFLIKLYFVSKQDILVEKIKIEELEEGMISGKTIVKNQQSIKELESLSIKTIINYLRNNNVAGLIDLMRPKGEILASSFSAGGLTQEQIKMLKNAAKNKQIKDFLPIKKSIPFVPSVLIAYVVVQTVGDLLWILIF